MDQTKNEFFNEGLEVCQLLKFIEDCGGKQYLEGQTTLDVYNKFIKSKTERSQQTYCQYLKETKKWTIRSAEVFICHAIEMTPFLDLVDAIERYFSDKKTTVFWLDIFCRNPHHKAINNENYQQLFTSYRSALDKFDSMILIVYPWNNPELFTRSWCLLEIYCAMMCKKSLTVISSEKVKEQLIIDISKIDPVAQLHGMLRDIKMSLID